MTATAEAGFGEDQERSTARTESPRDAGRELDALIAEKVMGWTDVGCESNRHHTEFAPHGVAPGTLVRSPVPYYSTDIGHAWRVVVKLVEWPVWRVELRASSHGTFDCEVWAMEEDGTWSCRAEEDDEPIMPLAICRAALAAVEAV